MLWTLCTAVETDSNIDTTTAGGFKQPEAGKLYMKVSGMWWGFITLWKRAGFETAREREREGAVSWSGWTCEPCGHFHLVIHSRGGMRSEAEPTSAYHCPMGCLIPLASKRVEEWADVSRGRTRWKEMSEKNVTNGNGKIAYLSV